jgi:predicted PurR-regulated permease PerM
MRLTQRMKLDGPEQMEDQAQYPGAEVPPKQHAGRPLIGFIIATAVIYFAKDILVPIVLALVLAVIFAPVATQLERIGGRLVGALLVVILAISLVATVSYFLSVELTAVAEHVAGYSNNIANKITAMEKGTPSSFQRIEKGIREVEERLQRNPSTNAPQNHQIFSSFTPLTEATKAAKPLVSGIGGFLIVVVLLFFVLYERSDLRRRVALLAANSQVAIPPQAIDTAGATVSHYLLRFTLINLAYGISTGIAVWLLGLPKPEVWGMLGFLLRFIPYIGAITSAMLPTLVAFAVFPGWAKALEVLACFVAFDQISAQFVEPFLIGSGIGISPLMLIVAALYWSWLWGIVGLILAMPITACVKVAGDYMPSLRFFAIVLSSDPNRERLHKRAGLLTRRSHVAGPTAGEGLAASGRVLEPDAGMPSASTRLVKNRTETVMTSLTDSTSENAHDLTSDRDRQPQSQARQAADKVSRMFGDNAETGQQQIIPNDRHTIKRSASLAVLMGAIGFVLGRITGRS